MKIAVACDLTLKVETSDYWLLAKPCNIPWLIFVPKVELTESLEEQLFLTAYKTYQELKHLYPSYKYNLAKIGNKNPVFHIHLVFRAPDDALWPEPIWCRENELEFSEVEVSKIKKHLETKDE